MDVAHGQGHEVGGKEMKVQLYSDNSHSLQMTWWWNSLVNFRMVVKVQYLDKNPEAGEELEDAIP